MKAKRRTQIFITSIAALIGLIYLIFPALKIDALLITIIIIGIIPWLTPLLKSIELPGGVRVEFQDLQKLEVEAKKAGLINETSPQKKEETNSNIYSFIEIAEKNQELALVELRIEIEKKLRSLADKYSIASNRFSINRLFETLANNEIITLAEKNSLKDIIKTLNLAAHGIEYDKRNANWVIENGPKILNSLDAKLEIRGGRFTVGRSNEKVHWIDKSFEKYEWTTNYEWGQCIQTHTDLWEKELKNIYQSLLIKMEDEQKEKLIQTQTHWIKQFDLEKDFFYSLKGLEHKIGTEGMIVSATHFMNKIRERTLELEEILNLLTD